MNARQQLKPKTIRLAILLALADGAITTIDDLQTKIDEPRKKVAGAVYPAAVEKLIKRMRDDVTGGPAYQITAAGREYLAKYSGSVEEPSLPETPVCAESQTDTITPRVKTEVFKNGKGVAALQELADYNERMLFIAYSVLACINAKLGLDPDNGDANPIIFAIDDLEGRVRIAEDRLSKISLMLRNSSAEALASDDSIELLLANILHKAAHQHDPVGYVAASSGKPLARFSKAENAQARAMSAARAGKRAQVFALVPVGSAVPGAEWVEA